VSVATWELIRPFAIKLAQITDDKGELNWIESAWREIEKTIWSQHSDDFEWHRVMLRLLVLVEMAHIYCDLAGIDSFEQYEKHREWITECQLDRVKLALLCREEFLEEQFVDDIGSTETITGQPAADQINTHASTHVLHCNVESCFAHVSFP